MLTTSTYTNAFTMLRYDSVMDIHANIDYTQIIHTHTHIHKLIHITLFFARMLDFLSTSN